MVLKSGAYVGSSSVDVAGWAAVADPAGLAATVIASNAPGVNNRFNLPSWAKSVNVAFETFALTMNAGFTLQFNIWGNSMGALANITAIEPTVLIGAGHYVFFSRSYSFSAASFNAVSGIVFTINPAANLFDMPYMYAHLQFFP